MKRDLQSALDELTRLGFRIETIVPADDPTTAVVSGHGVRFQVGREPDVAPLVVPPLRPSLVVTRDDPEAWRVGRAEMQYRDLVPDRQGGRFIASHIRIPLGGPVADYVHFHDIRFQMIFCLKGWVRLVYEDQGEPFVMQAGDCVLQPPEIRHRVLECSPGLEVLEIGSPATHTTHAEHDLPLPTNTVAADRDFGGQRFVWERGLRDARIGPARVRVVSDPGRLSNAAGHEGDLFFGFVLAGRMALQVSDVRTSLGPADAFVIPPGLPFDVVDESSDLRWLEVTLPIAAVDAPSRDTRAIPTI